MCKIVTVYIYNVSELTNLQCISPSLSLSLSPTLPLSLSPLCPPLSLLSPSLPPFIQVQADLIKEAVDGMYEPTPPLFDPLGEGVDVSDIETSVSSGTSGASSTLKGGYKAKVSTGSVNKIRRTRGGGSPLPGWKYMYMYMCMYMHVGSVRGIYSQIPKTVL